MSKPGSQLTHAERVERHNRNEAYAEQVLEMFVRGDSYGQIAKATGIPKATVAHMCKRLAGEYARERYGDTTSVLGRELQILDSLTRANLARARDGDPASATIVMNCHIRRSKLLGLDAAVKAEITVKSAQDIEIERLIAMMSAQEAGGSLGPADAPESPTAAHTAPDAGGSDQ